MGNKLISYLTSQPDTAPNVESKVDDEHVIPATPISRVDDEPHVEALADKRCVAWEIDVSDWKPRGKESKTKRKKANYRYLREKDSNTVVGGASEVTSEKAQLQKITLPTLKAEIKIAQCSDDMKGKKALDLKRWSVYINSRLPCVTAAACCQGIV